MSRSSTGSLVVPRVHFIERDYREMPSKSHPGHWESGFWYVSAKAADNLVDQNGGIYLHEHKASECRFGGEIVAWYRKKREPYEGRIIFVFQPNDSYVGVLAGDDGWGQEKKYVW